MASSMTPMGRPWLERISPYLDQFADSTDFHGTVLVSCGEEPLLLRAFGLADRTWGIPHTGSTRFRVASVGKAFTAIAIWQLVESGLLAFNTPVHELLTLQDTAIPKDITVHHLLTMTAGLADWFEESEDWAEEWKRLCAEHDIFALRSNRDYLPLFANKTPLFRPGERYMYSNASFILLGLVLEAIRGSSYEDIVRQAIFDQAGMLDSDFDHLDDVVPGTAQGYAQVRMRPDSVPVWRRNTYLVTPAPAADGGVTSTAPDLDRFLRALSDTVLLDFGRTRQLLEGQLSVRGPGTLRGQAWLAGHGLSCSLDADGQVTRVGLTGEEEGVSARAAHYPGYNLNVIVLSNVSGGSAQVAWKLHDFLMV